MKYEVHNIVSSGNKRYKILGTAPTFFDMNRDVPADGFEYVVQELDNGGDLIGKVYYCFEDDIDNGTILSSPQP